MVTTPRKRPVKKAATKRAAPKAASDKVEIIETKMVGITDLKLFHKNPRIGNVEAIAESLAEQGQFRPILVNVGTKTKRRNEILAGNHTYLAAKSLGWRMIYATFVDVDDSRARKIVLADNRLADAGTYDEDVITELLQSLPDITGTGYNETELAAMLSQADEAMRTTLVGIEEEEAEEREREEAESFEGTGLGDEEEEEFDDRPSSVVDERRLEKQSDELRGVADLKEVLPEDPKMWVTDWDIPRLRQDMLVEWEDIPPNLDSWAGSATKEWPIDDQWWLYNWGVDSTSGMRDVSKVIVAFYCWDEYFENWFWATKKYVAKLLNSGINMMVTPNYSMWSDVSRFMNLWALYRSRYVGRYAQEAGIKVIPDMIWTLGDKTNIDLVLRSLPKRVPVLSIQIQTHTDQYTEADKANDEKSFFVQYLKDIHHILNTVKPEGMLIYANKVGEQFWLDNVNYDGKVKFVNTRIAKLGEQAKNRTKKKGI